MHDTLTIGVPVLAILLGILLNQRGLERLEVRMDKMNADLSGRMDKMDGRMDKTDGRIEKSNTDLISRIDRIQADLTRFYQILGEHTGKIELLLKK